LVIGHENVQSVRLHGRRSRVQVNSADALEVTAAFRWPQKISGRAGKPTLRLAQEPFANIVRRRQRALAEADAVLARARI